MNVVTFVKNTLFGAIACALSSLSWADLHTHGLSDGTQLRGTLADKLSKNQSFKIELLSQEQRQAIANSTTWQRLLFFKNGKSQISDPNFFLTKEGATNPEAELSALLKAIQNKDTKTTCRFVARTHFIQKELSALGITLKLERCADFEAWTKGLDAGRLSFIFAEEHPNALGSAFAHAFLRLDTHRSLATQADEDAIAINYSSIRPKGDGEAVSAVKSMFGAYNSGLDFLNYADKQNDYLVKDERDIWQYELDLSQEELDQIIAHLWETKDIERPYFFTHNNCATEIVRLIDVVRPDKHIAKDMGSIVIPAKVAQILSKNGMIKHTQFIPSNATQRQALLNNGTTVSQLQPNANNPALASPTHRVGVVVGYDDSHGTHGDKGAIYGVSVRSAYQDLLDRPEGVRKFLDLEILSFDAHVDDEKLKLDKLTIFSSRSYNPINTAKNNPNPKPKSAWGMSLGLKQAVDASGADNADHLVMDTKIERGRSWAFGKTHVGTGDVADNLCYVLGGVNAQLGKLNQGYRLGLGASAGCVAHLSDNWRAVGELALPVWFHHDKSDSRSMYVQPELSFGVQYDLNRKNAVRLTGNVQKNHSDTHEQLKLQYLRYF